MADVLLCSKPFNDRCGDRLDAIAPDIERIVVDGDADLTPDELERVTLVHFSWDVWPNHHIPFMIASVQSSNLRWFHTMSAGVDHPIFQQLMDRGVRLTKSPGTSSTPIAQTAMMYLLALSQDLPGFLRSQSNREWTWRSWNELPGRSVAVVGWGPIGQEVARLADALGMEVTAVRRSARGDEGFPTRTLDELVDVAHDHDVMVLALPLTPDTNTIVDAAVIDALGPDGLLVNVGRGELLDQSALTSALVGGRLGGAGLDVTTPEPLPDDDPLWTAPNVIITPHTSGSTDGTMRRSDQIFLDNLAAWRDGERLLTEVIP